MILLDGDIVAHRSAWATKDAEDVEETLDKVDDVINLPNQD